MVEKKTIGMAALAAFLVLSGAFNFVQHNDKSEMQDILDVQEKVMTESKNIPKVECNGETWFVMDDDGYLHEYTLIKTKDNKQGYLGECI